MGSGATGLARVLLLPRLVFAIQLRLAWNPYQRLGVVVRLVLVIPLMFIVRASVVVALGRLVQKAVLQFGLRRICVESTH